jgi:hypothetical protein
VHAYITNLSFQQQLKYKGACCNAHAMSSNTVVRGLCALAHESRLAIFRALVVAGPDGLAAGDIAQQIGVSPSGLSFTADGRSRCEWEASETCCCAEFPQPIHSADRSGMNSTAAHKVQRTYDYPCAAMVLCDCRSRNEVDKKLSW